MKTKHLFTFAFAAFALAFAGCSDDDDVRNVNSEPQPGEKGALVEGISINFGESQDTKTRAYSGSQTGQGTEGMIYEAYIFAKEANPTHARPLDGDWTVIRVTADETKVYQEIGGVDTESITKDKLETAINKGSISEQQWLVQNVASFKGVRQGDYVYVIANDPNLTLSQAAALAHAGEKSEDAIKGYIASINKDYLNGLTFAPEKKVLNEKTGKMEKLLPSGKFFMAGREMIPVSPNIPSNGTFSMTIGLDRELSKVNFTASISTNDADAAKGKVAFQEGDGIVVARIARKASPFAEQVPNWYVPANNCVENWPINDHSLVNGVYSSFCDNTREGSFVFDGTSATPITDWIAGTTIPANFNSAAPASNVTEYRYIWKLKEGEDLTKSDNLVHLSGDLGTISAPIFYTTPNYSNNTNSVTVICTQATYTHRGVFALSDITDEHIDAALNADKDIVLYTTEEVEKLKDAGITVHTDLETSGVTMPNVLMQTLNTENGQFADSDIRAEVKAAIDAFGLQTLDEKTYDAKNTEISELSSVDYADYKSYMDRFYAAVLIQQRLDNKMTTVAGTKTASTSKDTWGNGIPTGTTALLASPKQLAATDSLLAGCTVAADKVHLANPFYIDASLLNVSQLRISQTIAQFVFEAAKDTPKVETVGVETRAEYFGKLDAFEYVKGQKLYYRADVADYVGGVSNKLTERNMYYTSRGTIQSLGAKSIHDAIYSDQNTMHIDVTVNDWKLSINEIPM